MQKGVVANTIASYLTCPGFEPVQLEAIKLIVVLLVAWFSVYNLD